MYIYAIIVLIWLITDRLSNPKSVQLSDHKRWSLCLKFAIPLILVMGLRHVSVGSDTEQYQYRYNMSKSLMTDNNYQWELGYNYLNYLFHDILKLDFQFFLLFFSLFFCVVLARFIYNYSKSPLFSFYLHLTIGFFMMSLSGIRQCIAISLCYMAFILLLNAKEKKFLPMVFSLLIMAISFTFHNSTVIFIPFLFFIYFRYRLRKKGALIWILVGMSSIVIKGLLGPYIVLLAPQKYEDMSLSTNYAANVLVLIIPIVIAFFCLIYSKPEKDGRYSCLISTMFMFISMVIFFINMQSLNNQLGRLAMYFQYSYIILIPYCIETMSKAESKLLKPIIVLVCALYFVIGNTGDILQGDEYHFFWENVIWRPRG